MKTKTELPYNSFLHQIQAHPSGLLYIDLAPEESDQSNPFAVGWSSPSHLTLLGTLTDESAKFLADILENDKHVTSLCLLGSEITDRGLAYIVKALHKNSTLSSLDFGVSTNITDKGADIFAPLLRENKTLIDINLGLQNAIGKKGAKVLTDALRENTSLMDFWIGIDASNFISERTSYLTQNENLHKKRQEQYETQIKAFNKTIHNCYKALEHFSPDDLWLKRMYHTLENAFEQLSLLEASSDTYREQKTVFDSLIIQIYLKHGDTHAALLYYQENPSLLPETAYQLGEALFADEPIADTPATRIQQTMAKIALIRQDFMNPMTQKRLVPLLYQMLQPETPTVPQKFENRFQFVPAAYLRECIETSICVEKCEFHAIEIISLRDIAEEIKEATFDELHYFCTYPPLKDILTKHLSGSPVLTFESVLHELPEALKPVGSTAHPGMDAYDIALDNYINSLPPYQEISSEEHSSADDSITSFSDDLTSSEIQNEKDKDLNSLFQNNHSSFFKGNAGNVLRGLGCASIIGGCVAGVVLFLSGVATLPAIALCAASALLTIALFVASKIVDMSSPAMNPKPTI